MDFPVKSGAKAHSQLTAVAKPKLGARIGSRYDVECLAPDGSVKWRELVPNLVVNSGLDHLLSVITSSGYVTAGGWFVGLMTTANTINATDTATTHSFTISTAFSESPLPSFSFGAISAASVSNSTTPASFSINASTTLAGAYLVSSNNVGEPTEGALLFGGAAFSVERNVANGDTVNVTITVSTEVT